MPLIITKKTIDREQQQQQMRLALQEEHHQLAIEHSMLLDFVYLAASSKRLGGDFTYSREELREKACKVLDEINL